MLKCFYHPSNEAIVICDVCHKAICAECKADTRKMTLCNRCVPLVINNLGKASVIVQARQKRQDVRDNNSLWALLLLLFAIFMGAIAVRMTSVENTPLWVIIAPAIAGLGALIIAGMLYINLYKTRQPSSQPTSAVKMTGIILGIGGLVTVVVGMFSAIFNFAWPFVLTIIAFPAMFIGVILASRK